MNQHADRLTALANFNKELLELDARYNNGDRSHWRQEREADIAALEAGAKSLREPRTAHDVLHTLLERTRNERWWTIGADDEVRRLIEELTPNNEA